MTETVQCYGHLLCDWHLSIIRIVAEYFIILDSLNNSIKAIRRDVEVRSENIRLVDLVVVQQKVKLIAIFWNSFTGREIMLGVQLTHDI